jgi:hypothetical protein
MEPYVKEKFTKAIMLCGNNVEYAHVKEFLQTMINDDIAMIAKETPCHLLKFLHNVAYNHKFSDEFRDCIQSVVYERLIDDQATMFLVKKLRNMCEMKDEIIKMKNKKLK